MALSNEEIMEQYNETLKPVSPEKRTIKPFGLGAIWFGIVVQLTGFAVFSSMPNYFTIRELLWLYLIGAAVTAIAAIFMQDIGLKHGLCYARSTVASFGYRGSKLPAFIRAFPSVIFFGMNAYVSSQALNELFKIFFGFDNVTVALAINIVLLVLLTLKGLKGIERFTKFVAPLLLVIGIFLAWLLWNHYRVPIADLMNMGGTAAAGTKGWLYGISAAIGIFIMCSMGNNDYTRDCVVDTNAKTWGRMNKKYTVATLIGVIPFLTFFSLLGNCAVVLSGRTDVIVVFSELIQTKSMVLAVIVDLFIVLAQFTTNTAANLLPSAYVACDFFPKRLKFKPAIVVVAILAVICQPWSYYDYFDFVMNLFTVFTGPAMAIMLVDYFIFRKREYDIPALYNKDGKYNYFKGFNTIAMAVYIVSGLIGYLINFDNSFFIATPIAAVGYYLLAKAFGKKNPVMVSE